MKSFEHFPWCHCRTFSYRERSCIPPLTWLFFYPPLTTWRKHYCNIQRMHLR
nr:MAG TPA: hypothetical protein [Caudoviricetes sp.]